MMSLIEVRKVEDRRMMKEFILFPWTSRIYENDPAWIPPLIREQKRLFNRKRSHFFEIGEGDFFLAYRQGRPVGRITAHVNRLYEAKYDRDTGFFGFYESIHDQKTANALFDTASQWLRERGKKVIQGPQSFSVYDSVGFETEGLDITPVVGLFHFAPYYKDLAEAYGFAKCIDWYCYLVRDIEDYRPYLDRIRKSFMKDQGIEYKTLQKGEMKRRVREIHRIFNIAWEGNWGHLPLTERQMEVLYGELKAVVIPELAIFAEDNGKTVGFCLSIADANQALRILNGRLYPWRLYRAFREVRKARKIRTMIMGVLPEYRWKRIDEVFYLMTIETGLSMGYNASDCSLIVETNRKMIGALKHLNAERYKTYRIYEKRIDAP